MAGGTAQYTGMVGGIYEKFKIKKFFIVKMDFLLEIYSDIN